MHGICVAAPSARASRRTVGKLHGGRHRKTSWWTSLGSSIWATCTRFQWELTLCGSALDRLELPRPRAGGFGCSKVLIRTARTGSVPTKCGSGSKGSSSAIRGPVASSSASRPGAEDGRHSMIAPLLEGEGHPFIDHRHRSSRESTLSPASRSTAPVWTRTSGYARLKNIQSP